MRSRQAGVKDRLCGVCRTSAGHNRATCAIFLHNNSNFHLAKLGFMASGGSQIELSVVQNVNEMVFSLQTTRSLISSKLHVPFTICLGLTHYLIEHGNTQLCLTIGAPID